MNRGGKARRLPRVNLCGTIAAKRLLYHGVPAGSA